MLNLNDPRIFLCRYETFDAASEDLERPYTALASLLNCSPDEIAIVTSATEAWQQVIYGLASNWAPGDRILTSLCEYGSNYIAYLHLKKRTGIEIEVIPETQQGDLDLEALEKTLAQQEYLEPQHAQASSEEAQPPFSSSLSNRPSRIVLVSLNHVPTSSGRVYNVEGVGAVTTRYKVPFLLDACQSVGQLPVDVQKIGCDFSSGTGRKYLRAPRGSGFLYCSRTALDLLEPATLDNTGAAWTARDTYTLRPNARRFERYEMSFAAKVGLGVAVQQCNELGIKAIWARIQYLATKLRDALTQVEGVVVQDIGAQVCGLVSFTKEGLSADEVQKTLFLSKFNTSVSRVPSSRLDFETRGLMAVVRASVHYYNTEEEVDRLVEAVRAL